MNAIGVVQDGFPFTDGELARGTPRFWWSAARRKAFAKALARRTGTRHRPASGGGGADGGHAEGADTWRMGGTAAAAGAAHVATGAFAERHSQSGSGDSAGSTETGGSSDSGGGG
jgi:hypothetical protein